MCGLEPPYPCRRFRSAWRAPRAQMSPQGSRLPAFPQSRCVNAVVRNIKGLYSGGGVEIGCGEHSHPVLTPLRQSCFPTAAAAPAGNHPALAGAVRYAASRRRVALQPIRVFRKCLLCGAVFHNRPYAAEPCKSPMETSLASPIEMSRSSVCERPIEVAWDDGDHDEPQRADAPAGADRC